VLDEALLRPDEAPRDYRRCPGPLHSTLSLPRFSRSFPYSVTPSLSHCHSHSQSLASPPFGPPSVPLSASLLRSFSPSSLSTCPGGIAGSRLAPSVTRDSRCRPTLGGRQHIIVRLYNGARQAHVLCSVYLQAKGPAPQAPSWPPSATAPAKLRPCRSVESGVYAPAMIRDPGGCQ
jgi:hypothetical protein